MKATKQSFGARKKENRSKTPDPNLDDVLLENARPLEENQQLRQMLEERNAELAIIQSVQEGLASRLDVQAIYDLVGDKIREIFEAQGTAVYIFNHEAETLETPYCYLKKRFEIEPRPFSDHPIAKIMVSRFHPIIYHTVEEYRAVGGTILENSEEYKSGMYVPLMVGKEVKGMVGIANLDKENAYDDSDLRLLQTLANSMSVALENAGLFDETQNLLRETEQRNAELAIISSVQRGLASKLEFQSIIDLVGDQVHAITNAKSVSIALYDKVSGMVAWPYWLTLGKRIEIPDLPMEKSITRQVMYADKPLRLSTEEEILAHDAIPPQEGWTVGKSFLGVPFIVSDLMLGALSLHDFDQEDAFDESDERLLQTLANSMSVALENARLFAETKQRAAELQIINSVQEGLAEGVASKRDIQAIYELVGDKIRELFPNTDLEIRIYDPKTNLIQFPYFIDDGKRVAVNPISLTDSGISSYVLRTGQTLVINENFMQESERFGAKPILLDGEGHLAKSAVFVPLMVNNQPRGLLVLGNVEREHAFSNSDVRLFQTLVNGMSTALESARLFDETQRLLKETEQRAAELAIINSVQEGLASKLDVQAIYDLVGDKICDLLNAQSVWIITFEPATRTRRVRYSFENGQRYYPSKLFPYNKLTEHLITTKKPLVINQNFTEAIARFEMIDMAGTQEQIKSIAYIPIMGGEDVTGFISLPNIERENAFSESDVNLLSTFAFAMSIALENIRLFDETRRLLKETEQANQAKSAFLSSMSHELRTPLNAIINFVEMVARGMIGPVNQEQVELLDQALHSSKHLLNLIDDVLDISKIQAGQLTLFIEDQVSAQVEVEATLSIVGGLIQEKGLHLIRDIDPHLPTVSCDRRRLRQVLLNLISNAIKFTNEGTVTVSVKNRVQEVLFAVIDTGPGIPPDKQDLIFEPFIQAENGERQLQGTGLGLPISRSLIQAHGGKLWVDSERGEGSAFFFTLPVERKSAP